MAKKKVKKISPLEKKKDLNWYYLLPILFIVGILPLIVYAQVIEVEGLERINWKGGATSLDFFSYFKSVVFVVVSYFSVILLVLLRLTGQFRFRLSKYDIKYYIPLAIYIVFVIASFFNADYRIVASRGFIELFQGVYVLIGYALVVGAVMNYVQNERHVKAIVGAYIFVGCATAVLGISQYFGFDFFKTMFARYLILPEYLHHIAETLEFTFGKFTIYATMYNTNFVGSFVAILLPLSFALFMYAKDKKQVVLSGVFMALMAFVWIGSNSRAGYLGVAFGFIFVILLLRKQLKRNVKRLSALLVSFLVIAIIMNAASGGKVLRRFGSLDIGAEIQRMGADRENRVRFENLIFDENSLAIITSAESLKIVYDDEQMTFEDLEGNPLAIQIIGQSVIFTDNKYIDYSIKLDEDKGKFNVQAYNQSFDIFFTEEGFKMAGSGGVLGVTEHPSRLSLMDGYERFASSRGYIWSRSLPMLKHTFFVGYGPDMFTIKFPQRDYVGKINAFDNESIIVDKPHNMYLQIGINTGFISLLALLAIYLMYFIDSMKLYYKRNLTTLMDYVGIGAFTGVMAYLGAAFFNDQIISVAPLFYVMVGLGIAINGLIRKQAA
ncbi:MAG: O-antigen polymerase [Clostridiales bacterium 38_11]|nr:MAG: O-antigen polymerase [Clostridiales bacterium 38_11]